MLEIISIVVALCGFLSVVVGGKRYSAPEKLAASLASKQKEEVGEIHLKKAKQQGMTLAVFGVFLVGLGIYNVLVIHGVIQVI